MILYGISLGLLVREGSVLSNPNAQRPIVEPRRTAGLLLTLMLAVSAYSDSASADTGQVAWPSGWQVQSLPNASSDAPSEPPNTADKPAIIRQRAGKISQNGDPSMVVELTQSPIQPGHNVNVSAVLMQMRKSVQINFAHDGYQSACSIFHETTLGLLPAMQTTCQISLNGGHVITQTLVMAVGKSTAYAFTYAGKTDQYSASADEVKQIRDSLQLE